MGDGAVFLSYSRSEMPLVQDLADRLDAVGVATFLDIRDLVPGDPWGPQLEAAVDDAFALVLVVSERSVWESKPVADEWQRALDQGIRVVLAIADPVPLPAKLAECEWVDLRTGFGARVDDLADRIRTPTPSEPRQPETDFRPPVVVKLGAALAVLTGLLSLVTIWTVVLPVVLLPLPCRILGRSFRYSSVRMALLALPLAAGVTPVGPDGGLIRGLMLWGTGGVALVTWLVLRSAGFRRWMTPAAASPQFGGVVTPKHVSAPVSYAVESAEQDADYVDELVAAMDSYGHTRADVADHPPVTLRVVSRFYDTAELTPGTTTLPIMVSDPDDELPRSVQRTQWVDLRGGGQGRRTRIAAVIAQLVDDPHQLLRSVGVAPPYQQRVLPSGVLAFQLTLWACIIGTLSGVLVSALDSANATSRELVLTALFAIPLLAGATRALDHLTKRKPTRLWGLYVTVLVALMFALAFGVDEFDELPSQTQATKLFSLFLPAVALVVVWMVARREVARWTPSRPEDGKEPDRLVKSFGAAFRSGTEELHHALQDVGCRSLHAAQARKRSRSASG